ncbi:MAG TPA: hypothetical protein VLQ80_08190 [Candidatus Saccharimonadia bacterium]|nr:hypothetical protein [Candidatus Saccharimonadia bacterium]
MTTQIKPLTHRGTAYFQATLSIVFILGYFFVLTLFLFGIVKVPGEYHDMMITLLGILSGSVGSLMNFWFSRQRTSEDPVLSGTVASSSVTTHVETP